MKLLSMFSKGRDFPPVLSSQQRSDGRKLIQKFFTLNGISTTFLMENVLILYAIRNGVSDPLVAVLASFVHLTTPFMILGKHSVARIGAARTWAVGWFLRYLSASFLILAPVVSRSFAQPIVTGIILASGFGFAMFRSMGTVASTPLEGEVTTSGNRGEFLSGNFIRINITQIAATVVLIIVTSYSDDLIVYQIVIASACLLGFYTSTVLARVPESQVTRQSAKIPLGRAFRELWDNRRSRKLLFAWSAGIVSFMMAAPFMMITIKSGYGESDNSALIFSLMMVFGGIVSSVVNGIISDHVGPRPILLIHTAGVLIPTAFFAAAPQQFVPLAVGVAFFLVGYFKFGIILGLSHYFLSAVKGTQRVGTILYIRIFAGTISGLAGSVLGGGMLSLLSTSGYTGLDVYRIYFRIVLVLVALMLAVVTTLDKLQEWPLRNILGLLASPRDLYALFVLRRLRTHQDGRHDSQAVKRLGAIGSRVSDEDLRQQLESPLLSVRVHALQALRRRPFGRETEDALLHQLAVGEFTTAWVAAEILGEHRVLRAVELLRCALGSKDHYLQGKCMTALVSLGDQDSYSLIISLFETSQNPRIIIHGAQAISLMKGTEHLPRLLRKSLNTELPESVRDELLTAAASSMGVGNRFYQFLQQYHRNRKRSVSELVTDLDGLHIETQEMGLLVQEQGAPKFFTKALLERCRNNDSQAAAAVFPVLEQLGDRALPVKTAFCMALIIYSSLPQALPETGTLE